jgi:aspartyl-tRNA(Asn)/glutamyl-tRNA(Gln) amidotransferase subunit A
MTLAFSMDKIGVIGRSADDCGLVLERISAQDPLDPSSVSGPRFVHSSVMPKRPMRIGWLKNAWKDLPKDIEAGTGQAVDLLRSIGALIDETELPDGPWEAAANTVISVEAAAAFENLIESGRVADLSDPLSRIGGYVNQQVPASDYARALRIRSVLQKKIDKLFDSFDVIAAASQPNSATTLETNLETDLSFPDPLGGVGNLCGLPAISVPCGFDSRKLPIGIQFVGRALDESKVIAAARLFQQHSDWHRKRPPLT